MTTHARTPTWRAVNITPVERGGRGLIGLAAIIAGVVLLTRAGSILASVLELLLVAAGLDTMITAATGHPTLYQKLGHLAKSLGRPRDRSPRP